MSPKLPVDFNNFAKKPLMAILYLSIIGITVLAGYLLRNYNNIIEKQDIEIEAVKKECNQATTAMRFEIDTWKERARRVDSTLADAKATLKILKELGKIQ